ncbi:MAG: NADPH2:quinone reductase [Gammaproteobacteria bacterium]|jgi:NADPH2:quinone reductase
MADLSAIAQALRIRVWPLIDDGKIRAVVHQTFPLEQASEAHALLESSAHVGKKMLKTAQSN